MVTGYNSHRKLIQMALHIQGESSDPQPPQDPLELKLGFTAGVLSTFDMYLPMAFLRVLSLCGRIRILFHYLLLPAHSLVPNFGLIQKTRMSTLATLIQHSFGSPSHCNQRRKINKRNTNWKRRSKTVTVCR